MIRRIRNKFIAISMLSVILVLFTLIGFINFTNYRNINHSLDLRLDMLEENGGVLNVDDPHAPHDKKDLPPDGVPPKKLFSSDGGSSKDSSHKPDNNLLSDYMHLHESLFSFRNDLSEEAFFDTRYFTVSFNENGEVIAVNASFTASVSEDAAKETAASLYHKKKHSGFTNNFKFRSTKTTDDNGSPITMYIFVNAGRELNTFHNFLFASFLVCMIGIFLIFFFVVTLSKIAIRPITQSYEKQKRFITDASHEIKTPLAIIEANTEVIEMEHGESEWSKSIRNQISRLSSLTEKLVFLSRMDEDGTKPNLTEFNLSSTVYETADGYSGVALSSGHKLVLSIEPDLTWKGDKAMLTQLVSLMMDNAMKYASSGSDILVELKACHKGRHTVCFVMENAVDEIEPGNLDILFERFYRSDPSRNSSSGGHGIGLSVVAAIVHAHNGTIHAESKDGHSIRFTIYL